MQYVWLIPPAIMACALREWSSRDRPRAAWERAAVVTALAAAFALAVLAAVQVAALPAGARLHHQVLATWIPGLPLQLHDGRYAPFQVDWTVQVDPPALVFLLAITGAGLLTQWLAHAPTAGRRAMPLFACLSLMAIAGSFVLMGIAWAGLGIAFLGALREQDGGVAPGTTRRALLLTALGDCFVLLAMLLAAWLFGTADLPAVAAAAVALPGGSGSFNLLGVACLLLAAGVLAKGVLLPLVAARPSDPEKSEPLATGVLIGAMLAGGAYVIVRNASLFHRVVTNPSPSSWWWLLPGLALALAIGAALVSHHDWFAAPPAARRLSPTVIWTAVVMNAATYALVRFALPAFPQAALRSASYLGGLCLAGVILAAHRTLRAADCATAVPHVARGQAAMALLGVAGLNPAALTGSLMLAVTNGLSLAALLVLRRIRPAPMLAVLLVSALGGAAGSFLIMQGLLSAAPLLGIGAATTWMMLLAATWHVAFQETAVRALRPDPIDARQSWRFTATPIALSVLLAVLGVYPALVLGRLASPVRQATAQVRPAYPATAAECDTTVTPAMKAANPAAQFLEAAPCGPDGEPLPPPSGSQR